MSFSLKVISKLWQINPMSLGLILLLLDLLFPLNLHAEQRTNNRLQTEIKSQLQLGEAIYQKGILPNGKPLTAIGKDGLPFKITRTACMDCHRHSGLGTSESGLLIPPITGEYLFKTSKKQGNQLLDRVGVPRPVYDEDTLKTLIQTGIRPNGQQLNEIMPRYKISNQDSDYLITYLRSLGHSKIPGLRDDQIEFATIITPNMTEVDKTIMLTTMKSYMGQINKDVRQLGHLKSPLHGRYKPFRKWNLHVWNLIGNPTSWKSQLEKKYQEFPVFAIIGGYGDWQQIHQFCEKNKILALFPITDTPGISNKDFYTLYFSQGINLDAEAVAQEIINHNKPNSQGNILQIYSDEHVSTTAAKTLRNRLIKNDLKNLHELKVDSSFKFTITRWKEINEKYSPKQLIIWLDKQQAYQLLKVIQNDLPKNIYLSSRLINTYNPKLLAAELPKLIKDKVSLIHPFYMKNKNKNHLLRTKLWARSKKISYKNERVLANTYFGLTLLTGAIHSSRYNLNREYLMEQFEHMIDNSVYRSIYPHLSLGPDQRYASKGVYIVKLSSDLSSEWIIPNH